MRKMLNNRIQNCKVHLHEWSLDVFMKGGLCAEADLQRVNEFSEEDSETMARLEVHYRNPEDTVYVKDDLCTELTSLGIKRDTNQWVGKLYNGQVSINIATGCFFGDDSEYEEFLEVDGDEVPVEQVLERAAPTETDKRMMWIRYAACANNYKMPKLQARLVSPNMPIIEPKDEKPFNH